MEGLFLIKGVFMKKRIGHYAICAILSGMLTLTWASEGNSQSRPKEPQQSDRQPAAGEISEKPGGARMGTTQGNSAGRQEEIDRQNQHQMQNEMNQNKGKGSEAPNAGSSPNPGRSD